MDRHRRIRNLGHPYFSRPKPTHREDWTRQKARCDDILIGRAEGCTWTEIARRQGVGPMTIRGFLQRQERYQKFRYRRLIHILEVIAEEPHGDEAGSDA